MMHPADVWHNHLVAGVNERLSVEDDLVKHVAVALGEAFKAFATAVDAGLGSDRASPVDLDVRMAAREQHLEVAPVVCGDQSLHQVDDLTRHAADDATTAGHTNSRPRTARVAVTSDDSATIGG